MWYPCCNQYLSIVCAVLLHMHDPSSSHCAIRMVIFCRWFVKQNVYKNIWVQHQFDISTAQTNSPCSWGSGGASCRGRNAYGYVVCVSILVVGVPVAPRVVPSDVGVAGLVDCNSHNITIRHDRKCIFISPFSPKSLKSIPISPIPIPIFVSYCYPKRFPKVYSHSFLFPFPQHAQRDTKRSVLHSQRKDGK